jgi:hypothetical protein
MGKLISLSTMQPVRVPQCVIGQIVKYTGDMANHSGIGAIINVRDDEYHRYDVALEDGREFRASMLDDSRWIITDEIAIGDTLEILRTCVAAKKATDEAAKTSAAQKFAEDKVKVAKTYSYLKQGDGPVNAAKNIRIELKRAFPSVKFSVRTSSYSGGNSIDVSWTDGPTTQQVEEITGKYKGGSFDGMTDCYEYRNTPFTAVFGDSNYVYCRREYSDKMLASVIGRVCRRLGGADKVPTVEDFRQGRTWNTFTSGGCDIGREIHLALSRHTYAIAKD